jgi:hypothetical protein
MIIGNRMQRQSRRAEQAGAAVTRSAIAKALAQLELASSSARLCDPNLAQNLADILAQLATLQRDLGGDAS